MKRDASGGLRASLVRHRYIYLLMLPGALYLLIFRFLPMWGLLLAFKEYNPYSPSFFAGEWVGLQYISDLFRDRFFYLMARNTLVINLMIIGFFFPLPIVISIMLSEVRHEWFKRVNQSIVYLPHFLSWVVVVSLTFTIMSTDIGIINKILVDMNLEPVSFLSQPRYFWGVLTIQEIWKESGWGTILFLAAITGLDPQLYEAAVIDGAGRMNQIRHITLPGIAPTIVVLLIIRLGQIASVPLEKVLLMQNPLVIEVAEVFDTYSFTQGVRRGLIGIGVAVGMFKGFIGMALVLFSNWVIKRLGHEGIY